MATDLNQIILRIVNNPGYTTVSDRPLTWEEEDNNFIIIGDNLKELLAIDPSSGVAPYDAGTTYPGGEPQYVSYNGNLWQFISATDKTGITPGTNPAVWQLVSSGALTHERNKDQYLDFGGLNQVSAAQLKALLSGGNVALPVFAPLSAKTTTTSSGNPGQGKIVWNANQFSGTVTHLYVSCADVFSTYLYNKFAEAQVGDKIYLHTGSYGIFQRYLITGVTYNGEDNFLDDWFDFTVVRELNRGDGGVFVNNEKVNFILSKTFSSDFIRRDGTNSPSADINWNGANIDNISYLRDAVSVASISPKLRQLIGASVIVAKWVSGYLQVTSNGFYSKLDTSLLNADHEHKLPNKDCTLAGIDDITTASALLQAISEKNQNNGYAGLDSSGKVASAQLPSFVDDVIEAANFAALPATGEASKIYITLDDNKEYRWSGSAYVYLRASPGTTDDVPESGTPTNKYFTESRVLATILAGVSFVTATAITAADNLLVMAGKLQAQITAAFTAIATKQDALISGTNLRTLNNISLLGAGNIALTGFSQFLDWRDTIYLNSRGESEYYGDNFYQAGGVGVTISPTVITTFNTIKVKACSLTTGTLTYIRVYKSTGAITAAIPDSTWTFIQEFQQHWDTNVDAFKIAKLATEITLVPGENLIILYSSKSAILTKQKRWTTDPFADRAKLLYSANLTSAIFTNIWQVGTTAYWSVPPLLSLESNIVTSDELDALRDPILTIPSNIYAVVGTELNLYRDAVVLSHDRGLSSPLNLSVIFVCAKGINRTTGWQFTPVVGDIGTTSMTVNVYDTFGNLLKTKTVTLTILAKTAPASIKNIVLIGDSITNNGTLVPTFNANFTALLSNFPVLWGTQGTGLNKHEGRPGWSFTTFTTTGSPLVNAGLIDIANYRSTLGMGATLFDCVSIQLGVNDSLFALTLTDALRASQIVKCKSILAGFLADNPTTKIVIQLPSIAHNTNSGWLTTQDKRNYQISLMKFRELMIKEFDEFAYHANVMVGIAGLGLDRYYGYTLVSAAASARITTMVDSHNDTVHPNTSGYNQLADTVFASVLKNVQ